MKKIENIILENGRVLDMNSYDYGQIREITKGLKKELDVTIYTDPKFSWGQMEQIRLGLQKGLNVSIYADPKIDVFEMRGIRKALLKLKRPYLSIIYDTLFLLIMVKVCNEIYGVVIDALQILQN